MVEGSDRMDCPEWGLPFGSLARQVAQGLARYLQDHPESFSEGLARAIWI